MFMIATCNYTVIAAQSAGDIQIVDPAKDRLSYSDINKLDIKKTHSYTLAIKTNLLYDLVTGANIAVEVPIGKRFSVAADFLYAYTRINNHYTLQATQGGLEARYWLGHREKQLTGWNVGIYGMYCNRFDVQWGDGYQGDGFWSGGLSAGYSVPLSRLFNLDFSISGGYIFFPEVRHYHKGQNEQLLWQETRYNVGRISLTNVKVSLVWLLR